MRRARFFVTFAAMALSAVACSQLFGIEEAHEIPDPRDALAAEGGASTDAKNDAPTPDPPDAKVTAMTGMGTNLLAFRIPGLRPEARRLAETTIESGNLTGWSSANEKPSVGSNKVLDVGDGLGNAIWGRWAGGVTMGFFATPPFARTLPAKAGVHYVVGRIPQSPVPKRGRVMFKFLWATLVTTEDASADGGGIITANGGPPPTRAVVDFNGAATRIGFEASLESSLSVYKVSTSGGVDDLSKPSIGLVDDYLLQQLRGASLPRETISVTGGVRCPAGSACLATISGMIAGEDFDRLAIVVEVQAPQPGDAGVGPFLTTVLVFEPQ